MIRGAIYGLAAASIWGGMYVVSDVVFKTIPPFTLLAIRLLMGAAVLGLVAWRRSGLRRLERRELLKLLGVGMIGFGVSVGAQFVGTDKSNAVNGAVVTSASPAFIVLFAAILLKERLTVWRVGGVALATLGVLVIIDLGQADFSSDAFAGNLALGLAALTWGLYSVLVRRVSADTDTLVVTLIAFLGGLVLIVPTSVIELRSRPIGRIDGGVVLGVLYLGIVSTAVAMWLWNRAFALVDASLASLFFFAQPLVGAVLGVTVLGQRFTSNLWIGGGLIAASLLLSAVAPGGLRNHAPAAIEK